jgi:hypothetical protein
MSYRPYRPPIETVSPLDEENDIQPPSVSGMEALPLDSSPSDAGSAAPAGSANNYRQTMEATMEVYRGMSDRFITEENVEIILRRFRRHSGMGAQRSIVNGVPAAEIVESAPVLRVGLSLLDGSNTARVTRIEQTNMMNREPEQRSAEWRVNTACQLLAEFEVQPDLSINLRDRTKEVAKRARRRLREDRRITFPTSASKSQGMNIHHVDRSITDAAATIDSDHVRIVQNLSDHPREFDIESTLIEVDGPSLLKVIVGYKTLIEQAGRSPNNEETRNILEIMVEDVRRLYSRSPILFRMSTRHRIINAKNTRYGMNQERQFFTITTSRGIQEIIGHSASYYNSLDSDPETQELIRPRFLQMLVVLLSLINDDDLQELKEFLEETYRFKADRSSLELLILRVIPLASINSKVFLTSLIAAFKGYFPTESMSRPLISSDFKEIWDVFVWRSLDLGYVLPGTVAMLPQSESRSWSVEWPDEGLKDSSIFQHLQYGGEMRTFNQIKRLEGLQHSVPEHDSDKADLTVIMANNKRYLIRATDYGSVVHLNPGLYVILEVGLGDHILPRNCDLEINETWVNQAVKDATTEMNQIIRKINAHLAPSEIKRAGSGVRRLTKQISRVSLRTRDALVIMNECVYAGRLTKVVVTLGPDILAVGYKRDAQKVSLSDVLGLMGNDLRDLEALVAYYQEQLLGRRSAVKHLIGNDLERTLHEKVEGIRRLLKEARNVRARLNGNDTRLSDEPVSRVIPSTSAHMMQPSNAIWYPYQAMGEESTWPSLAIKAIKSRVSFVNWLSDGLVEVTLASCDQTRYFLSPLEPIGPDKQDDQVRRDDLAVLAGKYMVIVECLEEYDHRGYCTNFMRITNVVEPTKSDRGRRRRTLPERSCTRVILA